LRCLAAKPKTYGLLASQLSLTAVSEISLRRFSFGNVKQYGLRSKFAVSSRKSIDLSESLAIRVFIFAPFWSKRKSGVMVCAL